MIKVVKGNVKSFVLRYPDGTNEEEVTKLAEQIGEASNQIIVSLPNTKDEHGDWKWNLIAIN